MAMMLCGSSTTQIILRLRVGLAQYRQGSVSVMLLQTLHSRMFSLASRMASASARASSGADAQEVKGQALRCFLADSGQAFELVDQSNDGFGEVRHRGSPAGARKRG